MPKSPLEHRVPNESTLLPNLSVRRSALGQPPQSPSDPHDKALETVNDQESFRTAAAEEEDSDIGWEELEEGEGGAMDGEERGREFLLIWGAGHLPPLGYTCPVDVSHR